MGTPAATTTRDLDREIEALRREVEAELGVVPAQRARSPRVGRHHPRLHIRRLVWRAQQTWDVVVPYVAALLLSVAVGLLVVYLTSAN